MNEKNNLRDLQKECYRIAKDHGFHDKDMEKSFVESCMLVVTEIAEAVEAYRDGEAPNQIIYRADKPLKPDGPGIELADALIRILDICEQFAIDIESYVIEKMKYNETRSLRHGGKKL